MDALTGHDRARHGADALTGDDGQSLVVAVLLLGVAAAAIVGLRAAQERILDDVRDQRSGEAAVAAAGAAVADRQAALERSLGHELDRAETGALVADPSVADAARGSAVRLARMHGRADPTDVRLRSFGVEIEVDLWLAGRHHVALLEGRP